MDPYAVDRVGIPAQAAEARVTLPPTQMKVPASLWKDWTDDVKATVLNGARAAAGTQHVYFMLNRMHPDEVIVVCLRDVIADDRFTLDTVLYEGVPVMGLSVSSSNNTAAPPHHPVPQPMRPATVAPVAAASYHHRPQAPQPQANLPRAMPPRQQTPVPMASSSRQQANFQSRGNPTPGRQSRVASRPSVQPQVSDRGQKRPRSVFDDEMDAFAPVVNEDADAAFGEPDAAAEEIGRVSEPRAQQANNPNGPQATGPPEG